MSAISEEPHDLPARGLESRVRLRAAPREEIPRADEEATATGGDVYARSPAVLCVASASQRTAVSDAVSFAAAASA